MDLDKIFPQPGAYRIQAVLHNDKWTEEIRSEAVTINIIEPRGRDLDAFYFIKSSEDVSHFFTGVEDPLVEGGQPPMEEFAARFSESAYGNYANFALGEFYFARKNYKKAQEHFEKVAADADFVLSGKASNYLTKIKKKT
jgi:hypothetical protein